MSFRDFISDERGVTAIEYAFIAALIFVVVIAGIAALGPVAKQPFSDYHAKLTAEAPGL
jgi:Flp pilus assembly pilin Flp